MRTLKLFMVALMCMMVSNVCFANDHLISPDQLPKAAQHYIHQHFKDVRIAYAEIDFDNGCTKYEVRLVNGVELKFDVRGNCYKVDYDDDGHFGMPLDTPRRTNVRIHFDFDDDDFDFDNDDFDDDDFDD